MNYFTNTASTPLKFIYYDSGNSIIILYEYNFVVNNTLAKEQLTTCCCSVVVLVTGNTSLIVVRLHELDVPSRTYV